MVLTSPLWIWIGTGIVAVPVLAVALAVVWDLLGPRPRLALRVRGSRVELWAGAPRLPRRSDLVIVPVGPDLQMVAGSALWARGQTAGRAQREALGASPREPGDAVLVSGARYRFARTALAVVMDAQRRYTEEWIASAVRRAASLVAPGSTASVLIPDWTPDLMRQPRNPDVGHRQATASDVAPAIVAAVVALTGQVPVVRLWVPDAAVGGVYCEEVRRALLDPQAVSA